MKRLTSFMVLFFSFSVSAGESHNLLRGYAKVNQIIHERVAEDNGFELSQYLDKTEIVPTTGDLLNLLGTYNGTDTNSRYSNGDPNSINMLLWYIVLDEFSFAIAVNCYSFKTVRSDATYPLVLKPEFLAALKPLCSWPAATAQTDAVLYGFWSGLVGYDAPPEEFQAWKNYFLKEESYQSAAMTTVLAEMALAALYNPYFLLEE